MNTFKSFVLAVCVVALGACGDKKDDKGEPAPAPAEPAQPTAGGAAGGAGAPAAMAPDQEARQLFDTVCAACHGKSGKGDGPTAANLEPKPRDYTSAEWQAATSDEQIKEIILKGGAAVGKSQMMPPQPQLASKPEVVNELVKIIRSFGPQDGAGGADDEGTEGDEGSEGGDETGTKEG